MKHAHHWFYFTFILGINTHISQYAMNNDKSRTQQARETYRQDLIGCSQDSCIYDFTGPNIIATVKEEHWHRRTLFYDTMRTISRWRTFITKAQILSLAFVCKQYGIPYNMCRDNIIAPHFVHPYIARLSEPLKKTLSHYISHGSDEKYKLAPFSPPLDDAQSITWQSFLMRDYEKICMAYDKQQKTNKGHFFFEFFGCLPTPEMYVSKSTVVPV